MQSNMDIKQWGIFMNVSISIDEMADGQIWTEYCALQLANHNS
jgi:hypothetical protein